MTDRINRVNARSRRVPVMLLKAVFAWIISAIVLALVTPLLRTQGVSLRGWMIWAVILTSMAVCVGPDLRARYRSRQ